MPDQSSAATEHAILQEITAPLSRLPDDPLSLVSADFPTSLRGYDRVAVDEYVAETRRLVAELQATRSPEAAVRRALERVGEQISGILQRAHETAEQITAQSRSEAEDRLQEARTEAAALVHAAEDRVRELDAETDRIWIERERIVADVDDLSAQLQELGRRAAARFPDDEEAPPETAMIGMPVEAGAPEHVPDEEPVRAHDEPARADDEQGPHEVGGWQEVEGPQAPDGPEAVEDPDATADTVDDGIEQTLPYVTFDERPAGSEDDTQVLPAAEPRLPAEGDDSGPRASRLAQGPTGIRPASEAAHRRSGR